MKMPKRKRAPRQEGIDPRTARALLVTMKDFRDDYSEVSLTKGGITVTAKFREAAPTPTKVDRKPQPVKPRPPSAIESLKMTPPLMEFDN